MRHAILSSLVIGSLAVGCAAEHQEVREEQPVTAQVQPQPTVRVHVEQRGYREWQQKQAALQQQRQQQLKQAEADRQAAAQRAAEAQARADELQRQAQSESSARSEAQARADQARQQALQAQTQLEERQKQLDAAAQAQAEQQKEFERQKAELDQQRQQLASREEQLKQAQSDKEAADARARKALEQVASVKQEARGMVVTLNGSVLFAFDEANLLPDAQRRLDVVADVLKQAPDEQFRVEGYTDAVGEDGYNLELSQRRADAVKSYLISRGVASAQVNSLGYGENKPVADNRTPEGRANNRRVEIVLPNEGTQGVGGSGAKELQQEHKVNDEAAPAQPTEPQNGGDQPQIEDNGADFDAR